MDTPKYRHVQIGWVILGSMGAVLVLVAVTFAAMQAGAIASVAAVLLALTTLLFGWLTVEIDGHELSARFGVGLIGKRVALSELRAYSAVKNPWYWGWGIRLYPGGWIYNVSGTDAVELVLRDGKRYRIGTDEPAALAAAIRAVVGELEPVGRDEPAARPRPVSKLVYVLVALAAVAIAGAVFAAVSLQAGRPDVAVTPTGVAVKSGFYGVDVPWGDVTEVRLDGALPRILRRTNGYAGGGSLRGHFDVQGLGKGQLFVEVGHPPFVLVQTKTAFFFVNDVDPARTAAFHRAMLDAWTNARNAPR